MNITLNGDKYVTDTIEYFRAKDKGTGSLIFDLDQIKDGTIECDSEIQYAQGKNDVKLYALEKNKTAKITMNSGYLVGGALASQLGGEYEKGTYTVPAENIIFTVKDEATTIVLPEAPVGAAGSEIPYIYKGNPDGTRAEEFPIAATASATAFSLSEKTITLPTGKFAAGDIVIIPYDISVIDAYKLKNSADNFTKTVRAEVGVMLHLACDESAKHMAVFTFPSLKLTGKISMNLGKEPLAQAIEGEAMLDVCSEDNLLFEVVNY